MQANQDLCKPVAGSQNVWRTECKLFKLHGSDFSSPVDKVRVARLDWVTFHGGDISDFWITVVALATEADLQ